MLNTTLGDIQNHAEMHDKAGGGRWGIAAGQEAI
jgi:hypothetical protein